MSLRNILGRIAAPLIYNDRWAIVPAGRNRLWAEHQFQRRLFSRLAVDCVLDVGANVGQYGSELRAIGYRGLIVSFEPDPACFGQLERRAARDGNWQAFNLALGSSEGTLQLNIMEAPVFNSFRSPSLRDTRSFEADNRIKRQIPVEVAVLNRLLPALQAQFGFVRPFLKMDTQGFDLEVFRGGDACHATIAGLQSEISIKEIYEGVAPWTEMLAEYGAAGFELAGLQAVNPHLSELIECDCYMVRRAS